MKTAYIVGFGPKNAIVYFLLTCDTHQVLAAQAKGDKEIYDTERPSVPLTDTPNTGGRQWADLKVFGETLGYTVVKSQIPKEHWDRATEKAAQFHAARLTAHRGVGQAPAPVQDSPKTDKPTWALPPRTRTDELRIESLCQPYKHVKEGGGGKNRNPVTVILVPANKGEGRVVFDHTTWVFRPAPIPATMEKDKYGLRNVVRDEWAAKKLNLDLAANITAASP